MPTALRPSPLPPNSQARAPLHLKHSSLSRSDARAHYSGLVARAFFPLRGLMSYFAVGDGSSGMRRRVSGLGAAGRARADTDLGAVALVKFC